MAVYTVVSDADFKHLLQQYNIGEFVSAVGISSGVENTNYFLDTTNGRYIATIYEKRVDRNELPFFLELMHHLSDSDICCPVPLPLNASGYISEIHEKPFSITSFLDGKSVNNISPEHCASLGKVMAQMHLAASNFEMLRANNMSLANWQNDYQNLFADIKNWNEEAAAEIAGYMEYIGANWPSDLPTSIIHADLFPDNVFFKGDDVSGVIDFYFACSDFMAYDVAICINAWCFEQHSEFNITKAKQLLFGYNSIREFSDAERKLLPVLCAGAAMRFLLSRLHDWFNPVEGAIVKPKNPDEYLKKLKFHMQVKSVAEYGL